MLLCHDQHRVIDHKSLWETSDVDLTSSSVMTVLSANNRFPDRLLRPFGDAASSPVRRQTSGTRSGCRNTGLSRDDRLARLSPSESRSAAVAGTSRLASASPGVRVGRRRSSGLRSGAGETPPHHPDDAASHRQNQFTPVLTRQLQSVTLVSQWVPPQQAVITIGA